MAFCDGASSGNPGPAGWGVVVRFPEGRILELGGRSPRATNNEMEIRAAIEALRACQGQSRPIVLATDSQYLISGATQWLPAWRQRDWKTVQGSSVLNRALWEELSSLLPTPGSELSLRWTYVPGHSGVPGNERADEIAVQFSRGQSPSLYNGSANEYRLAPNDLADLSARQAAPAKRSKLPALYYLSAIDGVVSRHATWAECEARVKGRAGARYKKVTSPGEEAQILAQWGLPAPTPKS